MFSTHRLAAGATVSMTLLDAVYCAGPTVCWRERSCMLSQTGIVIRDLDRRVYHEFAVLSTKHQPQQVREDLSGNGRRNAHRGL